MFLSNCSTLKNDNRSRLATMVRGIAVAIASFCMAHSVHAETLTQICVRTPDVSDAGTDTSGLLEATLIGVSGRKSEKFLLDNDGVDDLNRNTWSCFIRGDGNNRPIGERFSDVGPAVLMTIKATGVGDDWCMFQAFSRRYEGVESDSTILSESQFHMPTDGRVCFGDDYNSVSEHQYKSRWRPNNDKLKVKGFWSKENGHIGDSYTFSHSAGITSGESTTNTDAWSVAVELGTEFESELTGISTSMSVTSTKSEERSVTAFTEHSRSEEIAKTCSAQGLGGGNSQLDYWVWNSEIPQPSGDSTKLVTRESVCMIDAPYGASPKCRPGCFDTKDTTLQTCQTSAACKVKLR